MNAFSSFFSFYSLTRRLRTRLGVTIKKRSKQSNNDSMYVCILDLHCQAEPFFIRLADIAARNMSRECQTKSFGKFEAGGE